MRSHLAAFFVASLFAVGRSIAGMTRPRRIVGFLDVRGAWDSTLALVLASALITCFVVYRLTLRRGRLLSSDRFRIPTRRDITGRLVRGGALFGAGWGRAGCCPGPALTSPPGGSREPAIFVVAMSVGMLFYNRFEASLASGLLARIGGRLRIGARSIAAESREALQWSGS